MKKFFKNIFTFAKKYSTIVIIAFLFLFLYICNNTSIKFGNDIMNNLKSIATSFTPTTDLFDDGSEVSFVSYFFGMKAKSKVEANQNYHYPVPSQNLSTQNDCLLFNYSGIVNSICEGRVIKVGYNSNNQKCVEIENLNGKVCRYEGLETVGVLLGDYVLAQKPIGFSSNKNYLKISILENNSCIDIREIKWEN